MRHRDLVHKARPLVDCYQGPPKVSMAKDRYLPSYERRREVDKMNDQLLQRMIKIQGRPNQHFLRNSTPKLYYQSDLEKRQR